MDNTRELVLDVLMEVLEKGAYSHQVIRDVLDKYNYSEGRDKAFVKRMAEGTLERLIQIDYILNQFSKVPVSKMKPLIRNLLRMSVYQMLFMDSIPERAVCNEAVKLAGKRGFRGLSGFVNGVLRNIARKREDIVYPDKDLEPERYMSVTYSMPRWLVEMWISAYGRENTSRMLEGLLKEHPVTVRLCEDIGVERKEAWLAGLKQEGVEAEQHAYLANAYRLLHTEGVRNLPGFEEGYFAVQDVSSMLAVEISGAGTGSLLPEESGADEGILVRKPSGQSTGSGYRKPEDGGIVAADVCASPGGKSLYMAEKLKGAGKVISRDLTEYKVSLIRDNIERMGCRNIEVQIHDAGILDESLVEQADILLADLPCSGLGVMGKKRDIKYKATQESLAELAALQRKILDVVWQYVKPGGVLVYSTCTVNPGENQEIVEWFTANYPFEREDMSPFLPEALKEEGREGWLQLLPGIHESDGFFLARLRRRQKEPGNAMGIPTK